jgi:hypothetical protein
MGAMAEPETAEMVAIHRVFRREFGLAGGLIRTVPARDIARAVVVTDYLEFPLSMLHSHHTAEDELIWPKLLARATSDGELIERIAGQHVGIAGHLETLDRLLPAWKGTADVAVGAKLADEFDAAAVLLLAHLDEEERHLLPLIRRHLSVAEWRQFGERDLAAIPVSQRLFALGAVLEDATPYERDLYLAKPPLPFRALWRTVGERRYRARVATARGQ